MTRGQAYNEWIAAANNHCYCSEDVWNAAYDYGAQQMQNKIIDKLGSYDANKWAQIAASISIEEI